MTGLDERIRAILESGNLGLLGDIDHSTLYEARRGAPKDVQGLLAPYEHRAWAREYVKENPLSALSVAGMVPAYQAYKMFTSGARSKPSLDQVGQGLLGVGEGLMGAFRR